MASLAIGFSLKTIHAFIFWLFGSFQNLNQLHVMFCQMTCGHKCWQKTLSSFCADACKHPPAPLPRPGAGSLPCGAALTPYRAALTPYWEAQTPREAARPHTRQPGVGRVLPAGIAHSAATSAAKFARPLSLSIAAGSVLHFGIGCFLFTSVKNSHFS